MYQVKITGTGSYVPEQVVTNFDLSKIVDTDDEWIVSRTGIKERRITTGEDTAEIGSKAAMDALKDAGITPEEIDAIVFATITPDCFTPSTACILQKNIGAKNAFAFDISAACTGFIYALNIGTQFIKTGMCKNVLIVGAEVLTKVLNWQDRATCVLMGDGAGAAVLSRSDEEGILSITCSSDGSMGDVLRIPAIEVRNPFCEVKEKEESYLHMEGREVFKFATSVLAESVSSVLDSSNLTMEGIKYIVPHQANSRIIEYSAKKLDVSIEKFYLNLQRFGNTSSASVPIALDEMNKKGLIQKGDKIVLTAFGGGLTSGAALVNWNK